MPDLLRKLLGMGFWTLLIASGVGYASNTVLSKVGLAPAFSLLVAIILLNVAADIVGTAATAAEEAPLHAMATNQVPGARQAIQLVRRADRVANVMNDLLGDVFGTVSGALGVGIVVLLMVRPASATLLNTLLIALIAATTVGGKAAGKPFAIHRANRVMLFLGYLIHRTEQLTGLRFFGGERARRPRKH